MDPPTKFNTGDSLALKKVLDDTVGRLLFDEEYGFKESMAWNNRRLALMTFAALVGCVAQFAPIPLPKGRILLGALVVLFFILHTALQLLAWLVEKDYILVTKVCGACLPLPSLLLPLRLPVFECLMYWHDCCAARVACTCACGQHATPQVVLCRTVWPPGLPPSLLVLELVLYLPCPVLCKWPAAPFSPFLPWPRP